MTFVATSVLKPLSMATNCCLISSPQISCSQPSLSVSYKPLKFQLPCKRASSLSPASLFSVKRKEALFKVCVATEEENNPVILEEDEPELLGKLDWDAAVNGENEESEEAFSYVEPLEKAKVYVGNLPYDVDSERVAMLFQQAGVVEMCEVIYNKVSEQSRGFGFVTMSTEEEAEKAVEMFNRYELNGRLLVVNIAAPKGSQPERAPRAQTIQSLEPSYRIYVGNLPWSVDSESLEQVFSEHGKVVSARVVIDRDSGRSRGFGFVDMSSQSEMNDAIANLDGQRRKRKKFEGDLVNRMEALKSGAQDSVDGRAIRVNAAEERPRRTSRF